MFSCISLYCTPILSFLVVLRGRIYLPTFLISSPWSKRHDLLSQFRRCRSQVQGTKYFRFQRGHCCNDLMTHWSISLQSQTPDLAISVILSKIKYFRFGYSRLAIAGCHCPSLATLFEIGWSILPGLQSKKHFLQFKYPCLIPCCRLVFRSSILFIVYDAVGLGLMTMQHRLRLLQELTMRRCSPVGSSLL